LTALTVAAVTAVLAFALPVPLGPIVLAAVVVFLAAVEGVPRVLGVALGIALPFWVFLFVIHGVLGDAPLRAAVLASRITAMIVVFLTVLSAVDPPRLIDALVERRVPFAVAYLLAATLLAVPRLRAKAGGILEAQRCRGLRVRGSVVRRVRAIVPLAIPLIFGALSEVDERSLALEMRGSTGRARRTPLSPPTDTPIDRLARWLLLLAAVGVVVGRFVT
jgi:energy-coupling factor transport system permease protein